MPSDLAVWRCSLAVWSGSSRGLSMWSDSLYWQWLAWNRRANLSFLLLWLTIWPLACTGFKQTLHAPHRLLYRRLWKINEGGEVNKGGFRRGSFASLRLFSSSLWLLRDESTTKCFRINWFLVMYLACLGPISLFPGIFFCPLTLITNIVEEVRYLQHS